MEAKLAQSLSLSHRHTQIMQAHLHTWPSANKDMQVYLYTPLCFNILFNNIPLNQHVVCMDHGILFVKSTSTCRLWFLKICDAGTTCWKATIRVPLRR